MGEDNHQRIIVGLVLFVLFTSLLITFAVQLGNNYGRSASEIGGGSLNVTLFDNSMSNIENSSQDFRGQFEKSDPADSDDTKNIFDLFGDLITLITTPFKLIAQIMENVLNISSMFTSVILGLLSLTLIYTAWRLWKQGS